MEGALCAYTKRKRPEQKGLSIGVRLQPAALAELDARRGRQAGNLSRPEAMRRLIDLGLQSSSGRVTI